ncbi:MAG: RnfABCDGE type electron transport complex subunit D [Pseudomonadota bacterium]
MKFERREAPYLRPDNSVSAVMLQVLLALVPAIAAHVWFFGAGILYNIAVAVLFCAGAEALIVRARGRAPREALADGSAVLAAVLLAFSLPSLTPWWVTATGSVFAIIVAKHLYGGLGYNLFNPAMAGYVVILIAFPADMALWVAPRMGDLDYQHLDALQTLWFTLSGELPSSLSFDAVSRATPLDLMKTGLAGMQTATEIRALPLMGDFGGRGWEWIGNFIAIGGIGLLLRKIIRWHIPVGVGIGLLAPAALMYLLDAGSHASPGFHLFSGAALLCAFFIATDPVTAATSTRGRLIYGIGIGLLIYAIRRWGAYAEGVAFAVLTMNMLVPLIDRYTRPPIVGHQTVTERTDKPQ